MHLVHLSSVRCAGTAVTVRVVDGGGEASRVGLVAVGTDTNSAAVVVHLHLHSGHALLGHRVALRVLGRLCAVRDGVRFRSRDFEVHGAAGEGTDLCARARTALSVHVRTVATATQTHLLPTTASLHDVGVAVDLNKLI